MLISYRFAKNDNLLKIFEKSLSSDTWNILLTDKLSWLQIGNGKVLRRDAKTLFFTIAFSVAKRRETRIKLYIFTVAYLVFRSSAKTSTLDVKTLVKKTDPS